MSTASAKKKRQKSAAERKQRRQKVMAFGGFGVLAILMFIQGPKLLDAFGGAETPAAAPAPAAPAPAPAQARKPALPKGSGVDPFVTRSLGDHDPQAGTIAGPRGTRDPFAQGSSPTRSTAAAAATPEPEAAPAPVAGDIVVGTPSSPSAIAKPGWIVVLASIRTEAGRGYAERVANRARARRLGKVAVLDSSTRKPLRAGYYVVYTGPFTTLDAVQDSAAQVRSAGYRSAYVREIRTYSDR